MTSSFAPPATAPHAPAFSSAADAMRPELSFVIPMHNEAPNVALQLERLQEAGLACGRSFEVVAVDDGSSDATLRLLREAEAQYSFLKVIALARCFGQSAALKAGFDAATGRYIVTLDGDLQNDPLDTPKLLAKLENEGYDVVSGWRVNRQDATWSRNFPSWVANRLIARSTGVELHDIGCALKVYKAEVAQKLGLYGELHRFLPVMAALSGARVGEEPVSHHARQFGESKYGLARTFKVLLDLTTVLFLHRFLARPLHLFGRVGMVWLAAAAVAFVFGLSSIGGGANSGWFGVPGWLSISLSGLFSATAWLSFAIGILAELLARTYFEAKHQPPYQVRWS
jgi:glycosyltransferase involved in cell wall biosynthesis